MSPQRPIEVCACHVTSSFGGDGTKIVDPSSHRPRMMIFDTYRHSGEAQLHDNALSEHNGSILTEILHFKGSPLTKSCARTVTAMCSASRGSRSQSMYSVDLGHAERQ